LPGAELKLHPHLVVRKSSSRQSNTAVSGVGEGQGKVQSQGREVQVGAVSSGGDGVGQDIHVTNHVVVAVSLGLGNSKSGKEIQVLGIEAGLNKIIKFDRGLFDQVVHQITSPSQRSTVSRTSRTVSVRGIRNGSIIVLLNLGQSNTQPVLEHVVAGTGDVDGPGVAKVGNTGSVGEEHGHLGEPGGLTGPTDEVGGGVGTAVHVFF